VLPFADSFQATEINAQSLLTKLDARELHQRELATHNLAALPAAVRPAQEVLEETRCRDCDAVSVGLVQERNGTANRSNER
jgi:hypothetical protein